jgi:hypothetical protein
MTKENYNRQQVFLSASRARFFLLSHTELPTSHRDYHAAQTAALLGRTPEIVIGWITHGQLAPAHRDVYGCPVPASGVQQWLEGGLFQFPQQVRYYKRTGAGGEESGGNRERRRLVHPGPHSFGCPIVPLSAKCSTEKKKTGRQSSLQMGQTRGNKFVKGAWGQIAAAAEIEVAAPAESSRECSRNCSTTEKTDENKRICKDFKADVPDYKFSNEPLAEGAPGWSEGWRDGGGRGGGGSAGRSDSKNLMGRTNAEFWAKAVRFERL